MIEKIYEIIEEIRDEHVPDPRIAVFEVDVLAEESTLVLFGATSVPAAMEALRARLAELEGGYEIRDTLIRLPVERDGGAAHALVTAATAPMLAGPLISESHLSQVLLGQRVLVLREHGRWLHCRSSDGYLGWIHRGYVRRVGETEARAWEMGAEAPIHVSLGAAVLDGDGGVRFRLPWGARVGVRGRTAHLPDGETGRVEGDIVPAAELSLRFPLRGAPVVATAVSWTGAPYLWGGTTPWGVDCSGLAQAVYRTHGFELPRDSDQQAAAGEAVASEGDLDHLLPGDLLFFAEQEDRISHVAISMGGSRIVHSAVGNGGVRENDLAGGSPYERELRSLLVAVRRVISPGS